MASIINASTSSGIVQTADTSGVLQLQTASTTAVTVDASQNVGIGTTSPGSKLEISNNSSGNYVVSAITNLSSTGYARQLFNIGSSGANGQADISYAPGLFFTIGPSANDTTTPIVFRNNNATERMRIDSSGNVLMGTTVVNSTGGFAFNANGGTPDIRIGHPTGTSSGTWYASFLYNASSIGSIAQNGTTAVLYNTTSDYRLKNDVTPIENALSTISQLNPVSFTWIDGRKDDGFIAHELQEILPNCVTGEKDAVDKEGNPKYQQMDSSGVIPFLVKAIQEQQTLIVSQSELINNLKARIETLEGAK